MNIETKHSTTERYMTFAGHQIEVVFCPEHGCTVDVIDSNICVCGHRL